MPSTDFFQECTDVFHDNGLVPPAVFEADGRLHRCGTSDKPHAKDGAYILHMDDTSLNGTRPTLWWQNHRTGEKGTFMGAAQAYGPASGSAQKNSASGPASGSAKSASHIMTADERLAMAARIEAEQQRQREEQNLAYEEAATKARDIWEKAPLASDDHPYLFHKNVPSYGLKDAEDGRLLVSVQSSSGYAQSLQFIAKDGQKRFLTGGKKAGGFFYIPAKDGGKQGPLCICEGYATAASVRMATAYACVVAFDAGNLMAVGQLIRERSPNRTLIFCADNDVENANNVGVEKAFAAALALDGLLAIPPAHEGRSTDFNDLHNARGLDAVRSVVESADYAHDDYDDYADYADYDVYDVYDARDAYDAHAHEGANDSAFQALPPSTNPTNPTKPENVGFVENVEGVDVPFQLEKEGIALPLRRAPEEQAPYPLEALGIFGEAASAIANHVGAPLPMVANSVLGMLSICTQSLANVEHEGRSVLLSLYLLSVLSSGDRKSTVDAIVMDAVREHEASLSMAYQEDLKAWYIDAHTHETVKKNISKGKDYKVIREELQELGEAPKKPIAPCLMVSNVNVEGLYRLFYEGLTSLGLVTDEGGILFGGTAFSAENKLKSIATLSSLWSSGSSDKVRMGEGMSRVHGKRLACHIMVQPVVAEPLFGDAMLQEQGFLPRFLLAWPESLKGLRLKGEGAQGDIRQHEAVRAMYSRCRTLLEYQRSHASMDEYGNHIFRALRLSHEASEVYRDLYNGTEREQGKDGALCDVSNYASRCAEQALRLAGVLTLAQDPTAQSVDGDAMKKAALLALWYLHEAQRATVNAGVTPEILQAEKLLRWFKREGLRVVSLRDMTRLGPINKGDVLKRVLQLLQEYGYVRPLSRVILNGKTCRTAWEVLAYDAE